MIELKQVSKSFGERELFSNLSMTFEAGKVYALIGSSGSGKTTLMNMIGKLEPYDGTIFYRGKDLPIINRVIFSVTNWVTSSRTLA
ncbi:antimicrobial peptide ABC transporter ATPase [Streptococcus pneumoniae]|nr:antimicrobial peptide ABC transporter ATPase [Streptococcus pneumoniae]VIV33931.1 antimicrobial peptide ABC transporter ATPase [Streptococcus pneumoniae]VIY84656.1 antimicrobial peptide ABC transporter ATPase [Streptococcus pneumoniae]VJH45177.1 antimicrobial peptide ABC transporter ATPase [Streptococcus pneumoniae]VJJ82901.1 antimicrobial peptide ABC transporter ATPase [Streptococcus pneumoniae]